MNLPAQILHDLSVLTGDCHGVMSVDRVRLEPVGERSGGELVENTALVDAEVISDLGITPVGEVSRVIIDLEQLSGRRQGKSKGSCMTYCVETITTNKSHCVRQNGP